MSAPTVPAPATPPEPPAPVPPYAPERHVEIDRLRFAAAIAASACCDAYGTRVLPIQGGAR